MSDGEDQYPGEEVERIKREFAKYIMAFWTIGYGDDRFEILQKMA